MNPNKLEEVYDSQTKTKLPMDLQQFGKPELLMSFSGVLNNEYIMTQLNNMSVEEFVEVVDKLADNPKN